MSSIHGFKYFNTSCSWSISLVVRPFEYSWFQVIVFVLFSLFLPFANHKFCTIIELFLPFNFLRFKKTCLSSFYLHYGLFFFFWVWLWSSLSLSLLLYDFYCISFWYVYFFFLINIGRSNKSTISILSISNDVTGLGPKILAQTVILKSLILNLSARPAGSVCGNFACNESCVLYVGCKLQAAMSHLWIIRLLFSFPLPRR